MTEHKEEKTHEHSSLHLHKEGIKKNPWILSTVVVAIIAIVLLVISVSGSGSGVSSKKAADNLVEFVESQGTGSLEIVETSKESGMHKITYSFNGQQGEVFVSLDGKYLITAPMPLTAEGGSETEVKPAQNIPKSDKPKVELFIMSYCPYGTQTQKGILPVASLLKDKIDFKVRWVDYIMHGKKEADENTVQYCIQKDQNAKYLAYMQCFLADANAARCYVNASINTVMLNNCMVATDKQYAINKTFTESTSQFPRYNVDSEDAQKYEVQGSPTLVINGVQAESGRSPAALLATICSSFTTPPAECSQTLSAASPSAGFGYSTASDAAAAQCLV